MQIPVRISDDKAHLEVAEDTQVQWEYRGITYRRTLPEGYKFRPGAWLVVAFILMLTLHPFALWKAAALHDYLYFEIEEKPKKAVPRVVADAALKADDSDPTWIQEPAFWVVRVIGFMPWLGGT
jgi:hypothetical protein